MKRERDQMPDPDQPLEVPPRPPDDEGDVPDPDEDLTDEDAERRAIAEQRAGRLRPDSQRVARRTPVRSNAELTPR